MLPDYSTCVDRLSAYGQMAAYEERMTAIDPPEKPRMRFKDFWKYKTCVEASGHSILDREHGPITALKLEDFLNAWGMGRTGVAAAEDIEVRLRSIRPNYDAIRLLVLGRGQLQPHSEDLKALYRGLDGITNRKKYPDGSRSSITGKTKALLAIWGQTPAFDSYTQKNFCKWTHPPEPKRLPHLKPREEWYTPGQFYEMIAALDEWVGKWLNDNDNYRVFGQEFAALDAGLPVGRIIDKIYNWKFECDPLFQYLKLLHRRGDRQATLRFDELPGVLGFAPAPTDLHDQRWWAANIGSPMDKARKKKEAKAKKNKEAEPSWRMADLDISRQSVRFCCD